LVLDTAYHGLTTPAKFKIGVSGYPNNCGESWVKDLGFFGAAKGFTCVLGGEAASNFLSVPGKLHIGIPPNILTMKLVRDRIPDIIRRSGREPDVRRISGEALEDALKEKLVEEALELKKSGEIYEELADVLEVVDAIIESYGIDRQRLLDVKGEKLRRAGGFKEGYLVLDNGEKHKA
jgi:predicted house-cleaning noncanonical NTP pyrophosphatase (MazG superfamily)